MGRGPGSGPGQLRESLNLPVTSGLGLAVSGGGDSMAMLHLLAPLRPRVATVNHHLRPEAEAEAAMVAQTCARLGLEHQTLHWHWDGRGNLSDAARRARRDLLAAWNPVVLLAHTQDDVAETFLMRLTRGAGVDGLAAMSPAFSHAGATFLRPFLHIPRATLRAYLTEIGAPWAEDPTNRDPHYLRARTRAALSDLPTEAIAQSARHLSEARQALDSLADLWAPKAFAEDRGTLLLRDLAGAPPETRRRLVTRALLWLAPAPYPPRGEALTRFLAALAQARPATLAGTRFDGKRLYREARSLPPDVPASQIWDARFTATAPPGATLGALGPDLPKDWRETGLPRAALASSPALRLEGRVISAPAIGVNQPETTIRPCFGEFLSLTAALSH
nr:tRNA lysidine(34) synthetase TilS [Stagnihabitans tardus]